MKGKSTFTKQEIEAITKLIEAKVVADSSTQKSIRNRIRKLGFYASDFGIGGGYNVNDFLRVIKLGNSTNNSFGAIPSQKMQKPKQATPRSINDEAYILDLCDSVLKQKGLRQHRFDFLRGDSGVKLPVDA